MPFQQPQPPLSRRDQLVDIITELEKQRHEAFDQLDKFLTYEAQRMVVDTIKGIDILLRSARRELDELDGKRKDDV